MDDAKDGCWTNIGEVRTLTHCHRLVFYFGFLGNKIITISERKTAKAKIEMLALGKLKYNVKANGNAIAQINKRPLVRAIKSLYSSSSFIMH